MDTLESLQRDRDHLRARLKYETTRRRRAEAEARLCSLTGLLNLRGFREKVERAFSRWHRNRREYPSEIAGWLVIQLDLKNFKGANKRFGQAGANRALEDFVRLLTSIVRESDTVAMGRTGGDEFYVLIRNVDMGQASAILDRLEKILNAYSYFDTRVGRTTMVSWPVRAHIAAVWLAPDAEARTMSDLEAFADLALHWCKSERRRLRCGVALIHGSTRERLR